MKWNGFLFAVAVMGAGAIGGESKIWLADILRDVSLACNTHRYEIEYRCEGTARAAFNGRGYAPGVPFVARGKQYPIDMADPEKVEGYFGFDIVGGRNGQQNWRIRPEGENQLHIERPTFGGGLISDSSGKPVLLAPTGKFRFTTNDDTYLDCTIRTVATPFDWDPKRSSHEAEMVRVNSVRRYVKVAARDPSADIDCSCPLPEPLLCFEKYVGTRNWSEGPLEFTDSSGISNSFDHYTEHRWRVSKLGNSKIEFRQGKVGEKFSASIEGPSGNYWILYNDSPYYEVKKLMHYLYCSFK